ncbi:hypothetical protein FQR65_LT16650 [Abscondita terminalis]|nr:hypothetical protein FQR65_LT16650 [Abscondita terminalis]
MGAGYAYAGFYNFLSLSMTLGAIQDESLIYPEMGKEWLKIFTVSACILILRRSFGDNKYNVVKKAKAYMDGMVDGGIIASLKHFPGHGDTDVDSHHDLPQLKFSKERLDTLEMYPFDS